MGLKGTATIQLFDAETNELVQEIYEENMITNGINNILNPPTNIIFNSNYGGMISPILPIATKGMGGILVWQENLEENAEIVFGDPRDCIGNAGQPFAGTWARRGSYNSTESGSINNGYRHVWDFATNKCNGTIKCLSLTTQQGGDLGTEPDPSITSNYYSLLNIGGISQAVFTTYNGLGYPEVLLENNVVIGSIFNSTTNQVTYNFVPLFNVNAIGIFDVLDSSHIEQSITINYPYGNRSFIGSHCFQNNILSVVFANYDDIHQATILKLDTTNRTYTFTSIVLSSAVEGGTFQRAVFANNQICTIINYSGTNKKLIFDMDGQVIYNQNTYLNEDGVFHIFNDIVYYKVDNQRWRNYQGRDDCSITQQYDYFPIYNSYMKYPCVVFKNDNNKLGYGYYTPTIMSINNLATPVVKTSGQTMKITYDITQA